MKRILCVFFPNWPLQRRVHERPELRNKPMAITTPAASRRPLVLQCSAAATRAGVRPGRPLAEALAIEPGLHAGEEALDADRRRLEQLAECMQRYSPCVGLEDGLAPECLLADITGCGAVFKGEDRLLAQAEKELRDTGWVAHLAIADTIGAAWALAHWGGTFATCLDWQVANLPPQTFLPELPIAALRLAPEIVQRLHDLGIAQVRDLLALPREEIPARFGAEVLRRLDQALGHAPEVIRPCRPLGDVEASHRFEYAVDRPDVLRFVLERLTQEVQAALAARGWGARQLECRLQHESAEVSRLEVSLFRPSHAFAHLWNLLRTRLEQARVAEPILAMTLHVVSAEPVAEVQAEFVDEDQTAVRRDLALLIDRLSSRLGREAVTRPLLVPDPQPEFACRFEPVIPAEAKVPRQSQRDDLFSRNPEGMRGRKTSNASNGTAGGIRPRTPAGLRLNGSFQEDLAPPLTTHHSPLTHLTTHRRPLCLWPAPVRIEVSRIVPDGLPTRFRWQGRDFPVARAWGPERIDTGWWRGHDVQRDYYVVSTSAGTRFWLFHCRDDESWFLHGCFD